MNSCPRISQGLKMLPALPDFCTCLGRRVICVKEKEQPDDPTWGDPFPPQELKKKKTNIPYYED